ncbi:syntaxin-18 [Holotrichia oblita]|uniref:Syntaxin-18 n=1 Tax=Holotrichia oblita TaxID=644536 RepID=A0ACB9SUC8_HOLOL|nr:syntaxin-18 [Holotrichia oblita]
MDITILFKACVKTVRTTNKNLDLKDAKTENKFAYLNVINYLSTITMIEAEKEQIDTEAQKIINLCTNNISVYREELLRNIKSKQLEEHYTNVLTSLEREYQDQLSPEEIQMFESENNIFIMKLNSLSDEVKHMESKVVHIAELQELFTQKVLQQERYRENINNSS